MITPRIFKAFPGVRAALTLRGRSNTGFGHNLSSYIGDDPVRVEKNRRTLSNRLGFDADRLAVQKQVHGDRIVRVDEEYVPGESDGLVTERIGMLLAVSVADCVPVLLYAPDRNVVAGVHSGWRGTALGIAPKALGYLASEFGVRPQTVRAWIGPSAGQCCYEVGSDVADRFDPRHSRAIGGGKYLLDTRGAVLAGLLEGGIEPEHIDVDIRCTICDSRFHSYRRDRGRSGRMYAVIGMVD